MLETRVWDLRSPLLLPPEARCHHASSISKAGPPLMVTVESRPRHMPDGENRNLSSDSGWERVTSVRELRQLEKDMQSGGEPQTQHKPSATRAEAD